MSMRVIERGEYLSRQANGVFDGQQLLALQTSAERFALDERHDIKEIRRSSARLAPIRVTRNGTRVVQRQNVRMLQTGRRSNLGEKALSAEGSGEVGVQDLERDRPRVAQIAREIYGRHAALSDLSLDVVSTGECRIQRRGGIHGRLSPRRKGRQNMSREAPTGNSRRAGKRFDERKFN